VCTAVRCGKSAQPFSAATVTRCCGVGTFMRNILLTTTMLTVLTGGFAHAASTNDGTFANAALRELHKLAVASAQSESAAKGQRRPRLPKCI